MWVLGGTELQKFAWSKRTMIKQLICGASVASYTNFSKRRNLEIPQEMVALFLRAIAATPYLQLLTKKIVPSALS